MVPPPVISWFINPMNTIVISAINHSYGAPPCTNHSKLRDDSEAKKSPTFVRLAANSRLKTTGWGPQSNDSVQKRLKNG